MEQSTRPITAIASMYATAPSRTRGNLNQMNRPQKVRQLHQPHRLPLPLFPFPRLTGVSALAGGLHGKARAVVREGRAAGVCRAHRVQVPPVLAAQALPDQARRHPPHAAALETTQVTNTFRCHRIAQSSLALSRSSVYPTHLAGDDTTVCMGRVTRL
jgi:hypothetical protein